MMRHGLALRSSKYMLHNATRKNSSSSCHLGAATHQARPPSSILTTFHSRKIHIQPLPVPAVAIYNYDACDIRDEIGSYDYDGSSCVDDQVHQASHEHMILASAAGAGSSGSGSGGNLTAGSGGDGSSNRFVRRSGGGSGSGSGGSGGGTHQCPKCGAHVTFHESNASGNQNGNIPSNCFYCAACSGWFLIPPNDNTKDDVSAAQSKYLMSKLALSSGAGGGAGGGGSDDNKATGFPTTPSNRKISQSQIVMQHVSRQQYALSGCLLS
jgi:hypothetical protein